MYFGASFPYCSSSLMIAEPTMAPSEIFAIFFACSGVEIPTACRNHAGNLQWGYSKLLGAGCATIVLKTPYRNLLWKRKNSFDVISSVKGVSKKRPWQKYTFCQGRTKHLSAVPPWFTAWPVRLAGYQHIPGWITPACGVAAYSRKSAFPAPSVTHYDHLQFGPALSTPDSLDAHGDLYSHVIGLCCTVELLVGIIVTQ